MKQQNIIVGMELVSLVGGCSYDNIREIKGCEVSDLTIEVLYHERDGNDDYVELNLYKTETSELVGTIDPVLLRYDKSSITCNDGQSLVFNPDFIGFQEKKE